MTRSITVVNLAEAQMVLDAAVAKAAELSVPVFAVVINAVGQTVAALRVDGSNYFSERIAMGKARTAIGMGVATEFWETVGESNPAFAGGITSVPEFIPFAGGVPLTSGGTLIGAIGISGGTSAEDIEIANAAAAALN